MSNHPAARVTDRFGHNAELEGFLIGVLVGGALAAGVIATGGLGAVAIGTAIAVGGTAALLGPSIGASFDGPITGEIDSGSPNVFINGLPAAMVHDACGECARDSGSRRVATGSATVFINGRPAARVSETMDCGAVIRTGSPNVIIGGPRQSPICTQLRGERAIFERFRIDGQAANAVYDPPATRTRPDGYRNATPGDLAKLGLRPDMLEHPIDKRTGEPTDFRAAVFINKQTHAPLVAFKGTESAADWAVNVEQGLGFDTFYYRQAQKISQLVAISPTGQGARLTGHSLGGGMASAGSRASGLPATTFNPAGLNARTVPHPVASQVDEVYVKGEPLHGVNTMPVAPDAVATRVWPLEPPCLRSAASDPRWKVQYAWRPRTSYPDGEDISLRDVLLHFMANVEVSMSDRRRQIEWQLGQNRCG